MTARTWTAEAVYYTVITDPDGGVTERRTRARLVYDPEAETWTFRAEGIGNGGVADVPYELTGDRGVSSVDYLNAAFHLSRLGPI